MMADPLSEGAEFAGYRVIRVIAAGDLATVYAADDLRRQRRAALKVFSEDASRGGGLAERLALEVAAWAGTDDPVLVPVYDAGEVSGQAYAATAFVDGADLGGRLLGGGLEVADAARVVVALAGALDRAHTAGLVHGSVAPGNVLLVGGSTERVALTGGGVGDGRGDAAFVAPEQLEGAGRQDARSDQYALGAVLYACLTGAPPFAGDRAAVILAHRIEPRPRPSVVVPGLHSSVDEVIARAMAVDPDQRFATCGEFAEQAVTALFAAGSDEREDAVPVTGATPAAAPPLGSVEGSPAPAEEPVVVDEDVAFTVYRPKVAHPGVWHTLLAFVHRTEFEPGESDPIEEVTRRAEAVLGDSVADYRPATQDSPQGLPRGDEIHLVPEVEGVEFNPPVRSFRWRKAVHSEEFDFLVESGRVGTTVRGRLSVYLGALLIAEVPLSMRVAEPGAPVEREPAQVAETARRYRRVFASYSSLDHEVVEQMSQLLVALGEEVLRDRTHLRTGVEWSPTLERMIEEADVFQLFWSHNSQASAEVEKEYRHALALGREDFIRPVTWEDPRPDLPAALQKLNAGMLPLAGAGSSAPPMAPTAPTVPSAPTAAPPPAYSPPPPAGAGVERPRLAAPAPPAGAAPPAAPASAAPPPPPGEGVPAPPMAAPAPPAPSSAGLARRSRALLLVPVVVAVVALVGVAASSLSGPSEEAATASTSPPATFVTSTSFFDPDVVDPAQLDQAELDRLERQCAAGRLLACDFLYFEAEADSDQAAFGQTCGDTQADAGGGSCATTEASGSTVVELVRGCGQGDADACDELYQITPVGSQLEQYALYCAEPSNQAECRRETG